MTFIFFQIDGSTLKTLCAQHGPLLTFYLSLNNGNALVRYSSKEEAFKAQRSLNTCVLGNTTILADFANDGDIERFFNEQSHKGAPQVGSGEVNNWNNGFTSGTNSNWPTSSANSAWSNSGSLWGTPGLDPTLQNDIMGGE